MSIQEAERSGRRVVVAEHVDFAWEGTPIIRDFSTTIMRGDKVGIIGPNGCGKTTLLGLLLDRLTPGSGEVKHGVALEVAYFDQHREQLDEARTVVESVGNGSDHVTLDGERRHVMSYLQDFLFSPERAREPVSNLSGGERNRLLLARLFTRPANVLVLDEPTNDLDTETLELLEARLVEYAGTVLVVSHDRQFLDNLCSSTLVFEGDGHVKEYVGGYTDWKRAVTRRADAQEAQPTATTDKKKGGQARNADASTSAKPRKLSWAEKKEWESLPSRIEALEKELANVHARMSNPDFYRGEADAIREATERSQQLPGEIDAVFTRWAELDERA
jgi:ATP-binding cassette subfamily F protein uup